MANRTTTGRGLSSEAAAKQAADAAAKRTAEAAAKKAARAAEAEAAKKAATTAAAKKQAGLSTAFAKEPQQYFRRGEKNRPSTSFDPRSLAPRNSGRALPRIGSEPTTSIPKPKATGSDADFVQTLYRDLLGRAPDAAGMAAHLKGLASGMSRDELKQVFLNSPEYQARRGQPSGASTGGSISGWSGPGGPGPGELMPTPLTSHPGEVSSACNTPENKNLAPKSTFMGDVNAAIDRVQAKGIGLDPGDPNKIVDYDKYHNAVVQELLKAGFHAGYDGEEMSVGRPGVGHSEQFDISTSTGLVRRFYGSQTTPPVFDVPVDTRRTNGWSGPGGPGPGELMPTPLASHPGEVSSACNTPQNKNLAPKSTFMSDVNAAIDRVQAKGIGLDPDDRDKIVDYDKYHNAVVQELLRAGFHAGYDGEEMSVGRSGVGHSEQFDISTSTGLVRRFYGSQTTPPVFDLEAASGR